MEAISLHPTYKDHVKKLYIISKAIRGPLLQRDDFEKLLRSDKMMVENEIHYRVHTNDPRHLVMRPTSVKLTTKVVDFHYGQYSSLPSEQGSLLIRVEGILQGAIGRFAQCGQGINGIRIAEDMRNAESAVRGPTPTRT